MRIFLRGFFTLLPLTITFAVIWWLILSTELALKSVLQLVLPDRFYIPGAGLIVAAMITLLTGIAMGARSVRSHFRFLEKFLAAIPVVRSVYQSFKDIFDFIGSHNSHNNSSVVSITIGDGFGKIVGLLTAENPQESLGETASDQVLVYLPMSYQIGGISLLIPKENITRLAISAQDAMRFIFTAGVCNVNQAGIKTAPIEQQTFSNQVFLKTSAEKTTL